jgi:hypothetical protein
MINSFLKAKARRGCRRRKKLFLEWHAHCGYKAVALSNYGFDVPRPIGIVDQYVADLADRGIDPVFESTKTSLPHSRSMISSRLTNWPRLLARRMSNSIGIFPA